ncbi:hypothetical protein Tco_1351372 [Tanacetum coccineum]
MESRVSTLRRNTLCGYAITNLKSNCIYYKFAEGFTVNRADIENMTLDEYRKYEAEKERRLWDDVRSKRSPTYYNEADVDYFHRNKNSIWEHDDEEEEDQEEDGDDGDTFDMWDITVEDVERIRKFFNVPDEIDEIVQPLIPKPIHTTPLNDDYVAPATKSILDKLLVEFEDEILNVTMVDDEADFNPTKDLEELERLLAKEPQSNFMEIQVHSVIINTEPFIHTQLMSPLYGVVKTSKQGKVDRDIRSLGMYVFFSSFPYLVAYLHPKGVYCYFHPHLIPSEGMGTRLPSK